MGTVLKIELGKARKSKGLWVSLFIGIVISVLQSFWFYNHIYVFNDKLYNDVINLSYADKEYGQWFETAILQGWLGCEGYSPYNELYFLILPLLAAMPFGLSLYNEWQTGYAGQMITRCGRKQYLSAKFLAVYISGGLAATFPLLFDLVVAACYLPAIGVDPLSLQAGIADADMWASLYYDHPVLYAGAYLCVDFLYGGIFACITLVIGKWLKNRFGALMFPFLVHCTCLYGICNLFPGLRRYIFSVYLNPGQTWTYLETLRFGTVLLVTIAILVCLTAIYVCSNRKRDALAE